MTHSATQQKRTPVPHPADTDTQHATTQTTSTIEHTARCLPQLAAWRLAAAISLPLLLSSSPRSNQSGRSAEGKEGEEEGETKEQSGTLVIAGTVAQGVSVVGTAMGQSSSGFRVPLFPAYWSCACQLKEGVKYAAWLNATHS